MALTSCTVPAAGKPTFTLAENEMEVGIGIHGEPGRRRESLKSARGHRPPCSLPRSSRICPSSGDQVLALVNGMGATPLIELYLMFGLLDEFLQGRGIRIARSLVGNYITSLDMAGCPSRCSSSTPSSSACGMPRCATPALRWERGSAP